MSASEQALGGAVIEVVAKATRRRFSVDYKRKIVRGRRPKTLARSHAPTTTRSPRPSSRRSGHWPAFPEPFGAIQDARGYCHGFSHAS
jgi:hypothetical protein